MATTTRRRRGRTKRTARKGVSYGRYSTDKQTSVKEQWGVNTGLAFECDVELVKEFSDEAVSRSISDRPGLMEMFEYLRTHPEVGFIIVNELERLTGSMHQRLEITKLCQELDITIVVENRDGAPKAIDPWRDDDMQEADEAAVGANREVLKGRRRTRRVLRQKAVDGVMMGRPGYGLRLETQYDEEGKPLPEGTRQFNERGRPVAIGMWEKHPDEWPWLVKIFEWAAAGDSPTAVCRKLEAAKVPTKFGKQAWSVTPVVRIVRNPIYKGEVVYGRKETVRLHDGKKLQEWREDDDRFIVRRASPLGVLIEPDLWRRANDRFAEYAGVRHGTKRRFAPQVLDEFAFCGVCGHRMYGRSDNNRPSSDPRFSWRYACIGTDGRYRRNKPGPADGFDGECPKVWTIGLKKVLANMAAAAEGGVVGVVAINNDAGGGDALRGKRLVKEIKDLEAKRNRQADLYSDGDITREQKLERQAAIDEQIAVKRSQLAAAPEVGSAPRVARISDSSRWRRMVELLADEEIPVDRRVKALRDNGMQRLYLDRESVRVQLVDGDASGQQSLLRLELGDDATDGVHDARVVGR